MRRNVRPGCWRRSARAVPGGYSRARCDSGPWAGRRAIVLVSVASRAVVAPPEKLERRCYATSPSAAHASIAGSGTAAYSSRRGQRLWGDDGILDPLETRDALALGIAAALNPPIPRTTFGV